MNDAPVTPAVAPPDPLAGIELLDQEDLIRLVRSMLSNGVALTFHGKRSAKEISRKVRPRVMRRESRLHVGSPVEQSRNLLIEGENLQTMVTLYKYRGEVEAGFRPSGATSTSSPAAARRPRPTPWPNCRYESSGHDRPTMPNSWECRRPESGRHSGKPDTEPCSRRLSPW